MGMIGQLKLTLWKHVTIRKRQPVTLFLEFAWPVIFFLLAVSIRHLFPAEPISDCVYRARALPSTGLLPFMQSFICNLENKCENLSSYEEIPTYKEARLGKLVNTLYPLIERPDVQDVLTELPTTMAIASHLVRSLDRPEGRRILSEEFYVRDLFKDPDVIKEFLVEHHQMDADTADNLFAASFDVGQLLKIIPHTSILDLACNSDILSRILRLPEGTNASSIADSLCPVVMSPSPLLLQKMMTQINAHGLIRKGATVLEVLGSEDLARLIDDVGGIIEALQDIPILNSLSKAPLNIGLEDVTTYLYDALEFLNVLRRSEIDFSFLGEMMDDLEEIIGPNEFFDHFKVVGKQISRIIKWVQTGEFEDSRPHLIVSDLVKDPESTVGMLVKQTDLSDSKIDGFMHVRVRPGLSTGEDVCYKLCERTAVGEIIEYEGNFETSDLIQLWNVICSGGTCQKIVKSDLTELKPSERSTGVTVASIANDLQDVLNQAAYLGSEVGGTMKTAFPILDMLWKVATTGVSIAFLPEWNIRDSNFINRLASALETLPGYLPEQMRLPVLNVVTAADVTLAIAVAVGEKATEVDALLYRNMVKEREPLKNTLAFGPELMSSLAQSFLDEQFITMLLERREMITGKLCNESFAEQLIENSASGSDDVKVVNQFLCSVDFDELLQSMTSLKNRDILVKQVEKSILENDEGDIDMAFGMHVRSICHHIYKIVLLIESITGQTNNWTQFLLELDAFDQNMDDDSWNVVRDQFETAKYQTVLNVVTAMLGRSLDKKSFVGYSEKLVTQVGVTVDSIAHEALAVPEEFLNDLATYWPSVIRVYLESLADPDKVNSMVETRVWSNVTCHLSALHSHLNIPDDLDNPEYQHFLCALTTFTEKVLSVNWYEKPFVKTIKKLSDGEEPGKKVKILWTSLLQKVCRMFVRYQKLVSKSIGYVAQVSELADRAKQIFNAMNATHVTKFSINTISIVMEFVDRQLVTVTPWGWKHVKALLGVVDLLVQYVVTETDKILAENKVETASLTFNLPTMTKFGQHLIRLYADYMNAASDILSTRAGDFIGRVWSVVSRGATPCENFSLNDVVTFTPEATVLVQEFETFACTRWKSIIGEVIQYPLMFKLVWKIREAMREGDVVLDWNATSVHLWRLIDNSDALSRFEGELFPDVEGFSAENATKASDRFVETLNYNTTEKGIRILLVVADAAIPIAENLLRTKDLDDVNNMTSLLQMHFRPNFTAEYSGEVAFFALKAMLNTVDIILSDCRTFIDAMKDSGLALADIFSSAGNQTLVPVVEAFPDYISTVLHSILNPDLPNILKELKANDGLSVDSLCNTNRTDILERLVVTPPNLQGTSRSQILETTCRMLTNPRLYFTIEPYIYSWTAATVEKVAFLWTGKAPHEIHVHLVDIVNNMEYLASSAADIISGRTNITAFFDDLVRTHKWATVGKDLMAAVAQGRNHSFWERREVQAVGNVLEDFPGLAASVVNTILHPSELRTFLEALAPIVESGTLNKFCQDHKLDSYLVKPNGINVSFDEVQFLLCDFERNYFAQNLDDTGAFENPRRSLNETAFVKKVNNLFKAMSNDASSNENYWRSVTNVVDNFSNAIKKNPSHFIDVSIQYLSLVDLTPYWSLPRNAFQLANLQLASFVDKLNTARDPATNEQKNLYEVVTNLELMRKAVQMMHEGIKAVSEVSFRFAFEKQLMFFETYTNETACFCPSNKKSESARNVLQRELDEDVSAVDVLQVLCREHPSKWLNLLMENVGVSRRTLPSLMANVMLFLPDDSPWSTDPKWNGSLPFNWTMLSVSVHFLNNVTSDPPKEFYPDFLWSAWQPVFKTFGRVLPEIIVLSSETVCPLMPPIDYQPFTDVIGLLDRQLALSKEYQQLLCDFPHLNLSTIYRRMKEDLDLVETFKLARLSFDRMSLTPVNESISSFTCPPMFNATAEVTDTLNDLVVDLVENEERAAQFEACFDKDTVTKLEEDTIKYMKVIGKAVPLFNIPNISAVSGTDFRPLVESLLNFIKAQVPIYVPLRSVLTLNNTLVAEWSKSPVLAVIVNGSININRLAASGFRAYRMVDVFCSAIKLGKFVQLDDQNVSDDNIIEYARTEICASGPRSISATMIEFMDAIDSDKVKGILPDLQMKAILSWKLTITLGRRLKRLGTAMVDMLKTVGNLDINSLTSNLKIREILTALLPFTYVNNMEVMAKSLDTMAMSLAPVVYGSYLEEDLNALAHGLEGIFLYAEKNLRNLSFPGKDLLADREAMEGFLLSAGAEEKAVEFFLNTDLNVSYVMFERPLKRLEDIFCDIITFEQALFVRRSRDVAVVLYNVLCDNNEAGANRVIDIALDNVNLEGVITILANLMLKDISVKAGVQPESAARAIRSLLGTRQFLPVMMETFDQLRSESDIIDVIKQLDPVKLSAGEVTPEMISLAGNMLCGYPIKTFEEYFKLITNANDRPPEETDRKETENLPTKFCQNLYKQIAYRPAGSVIWGFVKPFLRGKILYTPDNEMTRKLVTETNRTFDQMARGIDMIQFWTEGFARLGQFAENEMATLEDVLSLPLAKSIVAGFLGPEMSLSLTNLSSTLEKMGNPQRLLGAATGLGEALKCVETNRFIGYKEEPHLERSAMILETNNEFFGALVFDNLGDDDRSRTKRETISPSYNSTSDASISSISNLPKHIRYKIRMDIDDVPSTRRLKERFWTPKPEDNFVEHLRYLRGFVEMQDMVDKAIIRLQTGEDDSMMPGAYLQQFPYPCHWKDDIGFFLRGNVPITTCVAFIFIIALFVRELVLEREMMLEQVMHVMGLKSTISWFCWFICCVVVMLITNIFCAIILKFGGIYYYSNLLVLFGFFFTFAISTIMFCYLVSVFFTISVVAAIASIIFYLSMYTPFVIYLTAEFVITSLMKKLMNLSMATAFSNGCLYIARYEERGEGIQWSNMFESPIFGDDMNFGITWIMLVIDTGIYFVLALYFSALFKVTSRTDKKKWHFLLFPFEFSSTQRTKKLIPTGTVVTYSENGLGGDLKSKDGRKMRVGISLKNLRKVFNAGKSSEKVAVQSLSLDFYEGQITTLLGQNGAGKTTTINMVTGLFPPLSGSAKVYGRDVITEFEDVRKNMGLCPQYNILFELLSMREHLEFYGQLKGVLTDKRLKEDVDSMLHAMGLYHRQNELAKNLSGGMRRRLCVAIAFVGGSRTIILDEPTAGVDPVARRYIWDLIVKFKRSRTILLTTHHLDEADLLSDRVAVIHKGKLLCCGSPLTLKRGFGSGYHLTVNKSCPDFGSDSDSGALSTASTSSDNGSACDAMCIYNFIQPIINNIQLVEDQGCEAIFCLPYDREDGVPNSFDQLFKELEKHQQRLGIGSYGLSCTTLEEVFMNVCILADAGLPIDAKGQKILMLAKKAKVFKEEKRIREEKTTKGLAADPTMTSVDRVLRRTESKVDADAWLSKTLYQVHYTTLTGLSLKWNQFKSLLIKRFHHTRRDWKGFFTTVFLPVFFVAMAMGVTIIRPAPFKSSPALLLTPSIYGPYANSFLKIHSNLSDTSQRLSQFLINPPGIGTTCMKSDLPEGEYPGCEYSNTRQEKLTIVKNECTCVAVEGTTCSARNVTFELERFIVNTTDVIDNITVGNLPDWIINTHSELAESRFGGWTFGVRNSTPAVVADNLLIWFNNKGHHAMPSYINSISNSLLRSSIDKLHSDASHYGISTYSHPLHLSKTQLGLEAMMHHIANFGIAIIFLVAFSFVPAGFVVYVINERIHEEKRLQFVTGVGPILYWTTAYFYDLIMLLIPIGLSAVVISIFDLPIYNYGRNFSATLTMLFLFGWATIPLAYILEKFFNEPSMGTMVIFCLNIFFGISTTTNTLIFYIFQTNPGIGEMLGIIKYLYLIFPQFAFAGGLAELAKNFIQAEIFERFGDYTVVDPFSMQLLGLHMIVLLVQGPILFLVTITLEYVPNVIDWFDSKRYKRPASSLREDEDVKQERQRVHGIDSQYDLVRLIDLTRVYGHGPNKNVAVDQVCLGIPRGECFGLLGINGAGKTTTFRMLTGELQPTYGEALLCNRDVSAVISEGSQSIGYCPQGNALDSLLTAEEHLSIYSRLRGIPDEDIPLAVYKAVVQFNLQTHARNLIGTYSCGTKRKLCTAIAVLGNPDVILMDEPTSGMDPATRRLVWNNVHHIVKDKRSVILTSHSMEECDTLCNRLAIMVNGRFQCLGSPQALKHKFGDGHSVMLRIQKDSIKISEVIGFVQSCFAGAILKVQHFNTVEFVVPGNSASLGDIFSNLEGAKEALCIEDFSVTQTTLDQVFVNFVRQQGSDREEEGVLKGISNKSSELDEGEAPNVRSKGPKIPDMYRQETDYEVTKF